jgi:hypothetical protein
MARRVTFYAERAFMKFVRRTLDSHSHGLPPEAAAVCILSLAAALEALVNQLFISDERLPYFDELHLQSRIQLLATWGKVKVDWGRTPWQDVKQLIRVRNWLSHFKDPDVGLISLSEGWVQDLAKTRRKADPSKELTRSALARYYGAVDAAATLLVNGLYGDGVRGTPLPAWLKQMDEEIIIVW